MQHSTAQHSTAQHSTTAQHTVQHTAQHSTTSHHITAQHSTAQHSTAQHSTVQHSTAQHSTAQHSTAQHSNCLPTVLLLTDGSPPPWTKHIKLSLLVHWHKPMLAFTGTRIPWFQFCYLTTQMMCSLRPDTSKLFYNVLSYLSNLCEVCLLFKCVKPWPNGLASQCKSWTCVLFGHLLTWTCTTLVEFKFVTSWHKCFTVWPDPQVDHKSSVHEQNRVK